MHINFPPLMLSNFVIACKKMEISIADTSAKKVCTSFTRTKEIHANVVHLEGGGQSLAETSIKTFVLLKKLSRKP